MRAERIDADLSRCSFKANAVSADCLSSCAFRAASCLRPSSSAESNAASRSLHCHAADELLSAYKRGDLRATHHDDAAALEAELASEAEYAGAHPEVVAAVPAGTPVLLDSGVRRGTDVVKALALGATAVGVGKPLFFSLAVGGERGVDKLFAILAEEIRVAMALTGCASLADITADVVCARP